MHTSLTRANIVAATRVLGRPPQYQGRFKGLDYVGLVFASNDDLDLVDKHRRTIKRCDYQNYGRQPVDAPSRTKFAPDFSMFPPISSTRASFPPRSSSAVVTLRVPSIPSHVAIISTVANAPGLIQVYWKFRMPVILESLMLMAFTNLSTVE